MNELTYRCNDKKRFVVFVPVCRASIAKGKAKCLKGDCDFHKRTVLANSEPKRDIPDPFLDGVEPKK